MRSSPARETSRARRAFGHDVGPSVGLRQSDNLDAAPRADHWRRTGVSVEMQPRRPQSARPQTRRKRPCTAPHARRSAVEDDRSSAYANPARRGEAMQPWWMAAQEDEADDLDDLDVPPRLGMHIMAEGSPSTEVASIVQPFIGVVIRETPRVRIASPAHQKSQTPKGRQRPASASTTQRGSPRESSPLRGETFANEKPIRVASTREEREPILPRRQGPNAAVRKAEAIRIRLGREEAADSLGEHLPSTETRVEPHKRALEQSEGTIAFPYAAKLGTKFCKVRQMRQNVALQSAVLAFKHQIQHPRARLSYEMKQERMRTLEQQTPADRTKILAPFAAAQENAGAGPETNQDTEYTEHDKNSFAFGWDTVSGAQASGQQDASATIWENVAKHLDMSVLLQEVYDAKPATLPSSSSTHKALSLLKTAADLVEDELIGSALAAAGQVLASAVYCEEPGEDAPALHFEAHAKLASENAAMRERLASLEAQVVQQDHFIDELQRSLSSSSRSDANEDSNHRAGESGNANAAAAEALQHTLVRAAPNVGDRANVVLELFRSGHVPVDELFILNLFELASADVTEEALRLVLQDCASQEAAAEAICSALQREDAVGVAQRALEKDPGVERVVCLDARSLTRLISFWELNWAKLCEVLWFSPELLETIVERRPDVAGKFLKYYSKWLGQGSAARVMFERHRAVMEDLLTQVVEFGPSFLEATLLRNRQTLRDILESDAAGEDLLETLADSSPRIVGTILDFSQSSLAKALEVRAGLLGRVTSASAAWLLEFIRANVDTVSRALCEDLDLLPGLCARSPRLLDALVREGTADVGFNVAGHPPALVSALEQAQSDVLEQQVLAAHPELLLGDEARLERLGLRHLESHRSTCKSQMAQTDPVQATQMAGHGPARSLVEIVGKRKARADGWTLAQLESTIADVYQDKVDADTIDDRAGHAREPLSEVVYDHFLSKEEDVASTKRSLAAFTASIRSAADQSTLVRWFGILTGAIDADRYSLQAEGFYLALLRSLVPGEDVGECIDVASGVTLLPFLQVVEAVLSLASMYWYEVSDREALLDRLGELQQYEIANGDFMGESDSKKLWAKSAEDDLEHLKSSPSLDEESSTPSSDSPGAEDVADKASGGAAPGALFGDAALGEGAEVDLGDTSRSSVKMKSIVQSRIMSQSNRLASDIFTMMKGRRLSSARQSAAAEAARPFGAKTTLCVSLHEVMDVVMRAWYAMEQSEYDTLYEIFKSGDANGDGILDMDEWELLVLVVDPHADPRTVRRMFKMTGEENEDGEHIITPSEFVEVMRANKYTGPALAHLQRKMLAPAAPGSG